MVLSSGTFDADNISDHRVTYCDIKLPSRKRAQKCFFSDFKCFKEDEFYKDLFNVPWDNIYYMSEVDDKV